MYNNMMASLFFKRDLASSYASGYKWSSLLHSFSLLRMVGVRDPAICEKIFFFADPQCVEYVFQYYNDRRHNKYSSCGACRGGHTDLVDKLIARGGFDRMAGFIGACRGGRLEIAKLIHATHSDPQQYILVDQNMFDSAEYGHLPVLKWLVETFEPSRTLISHAMLGAGYGGQQAVIEYLLSMGGTYYDGAMWGAAHVGCRQIVDKMLALGATNLNMSILEAQRGGQTAMFEYLCSIRDEQK